LILFNYTAKRDGITISVAILSLFVNWCNTEYNLDNVLPRTDEPEED
jgi:hypothetical protein